MFLLGILLLVIGGSAFYIDQHPEIKYKILNYGFMFDPRGEFYFTLSALCMIIGFVFIITGLGGN